VPVATVLVQFDVKFCKVLMHYEHCFINCFVFHRCSLRIKEDVYGN
jgi:hypothetical protein